MSYSEERLMILKMLQEGKISSEEAVKLLDALNDEKSAKQASAGSTSGNGAGAGASAGTGAGASGAGPGADAGTGSYQYSGSSSGQQGQYKRSNLQDDLNRMKDSMNKWGQDLKNKYSQKDFDQAVEEFAQKAEKVGKDVANTTIGVLDKVMDYVSSFIDTNTFRYFGDYNVEKRTYEAAAEEGMDLAIEGRNGQISVKKHEGSGIIILTKIRCREQNPEQIISFDSVPGSLNLRINNAANMSVSHEVLVPEVKFGNIKLLTTNARIYAENVTASSFDGSTKNSGIDVSGINSMKLNLFTKNARIQGNNIIAEEMTTVTKNSSIDLKNIEAVKIDAATKNARINIESVHNGCKEGSGSNLTEMRLRTANSNIKVNMNDIDNMGYKVKALTSNGGINLLIPDVIYSNVNRPGAGGRFAEAESRNFEECSSRISIDAETSNGFIEIVK